MALLGTTRLLIIKKKKKSMKELFQTLIVKRLLYVHIITWMSYFTRAAGPYEDTRTGPNQVLDPSLLGFHEQ